MSQKEDEVRNDWSGLLMLSAILFGLVLAGSVGNQVSVMLAICPVDTDWYGEEEVLCRPNWFAFVMSAVATFLVWAWGLAAILKLNQIASDIRTMQGSDQEHQ